MHNGSNIVLKVNLFDRTTGQQPKFIKSTSYQFVDENANAFDMEFCDYSRIDGYPIFSLDRSNCSPQTVLANMTYNGVKPVSVELVRALEDHSHVYASYLRNKDILMELFFDMYDIELEKLHTKEGLKEVMRDIKITNILN